MARRLPRPPDGRALAGKLPFAPKAKQVIYLHMVGGPPQMDMYDYKPVMGQWFDKDLPDSVRMGQRLTTMTSGQKRFPIAPSKYKFARHGQSGMWVCELLPYTSRMVDDMCFIRSMHTEAINHEPAITYMQTGNQITGRPCLGAWVILWPGLAQRQPADVRRARCQADQHRAVAGDLSPAVVIGLSSGRARRRVVPQRRRPDPVYQQPAGVSPQVRRDTLDGLRALNEMNYAQVGDPETHTRIEQYELAFRMQSSVPELTSVTSEPASTYTLYGEEAKKPGTFAHSALLARRMVERGVRFVQIYHNNWDTHFNVGGRLPDQCRDVDQPCCGIDPRPQGPRAAGRNTRHLGRRIRPDHLFPGRPEPRQLRPRSPPPLLHHVDGRRRLAARGHLR